MNVGRTPTELYDEMQPDYSASGMYPLTRNPRIAAVLVQSEKGGSNQIHFIFEINVGKRRI